MRRNVAALSCLILLAALGPLALAQDEKEPPFALVVERTAYRGLPVLKVYVRDETKEPRDITSPWGPSWNVANLCDAKVDGQTAELLTRGSFGFGGERRTLDAGERAYYGVIVFNREAVDRYGGYCAEVGLIREAGGVRSIAPVRPGKHTLALTAPRQPWRNFGPVKSLTVDVDVPAKDIRGPDTEEAAPPELRLFVAESPRKHAIFIHMNIENLSDRFFPGEGNRTWATVTAPWFDYEVDGVPVQPSLRVGRNFKVDPKYKYPPRLPAPPLGTWLHDVAAIPLAGWENDVTLHDNPRIPLLLVPSGKHTIRAVPNARWREVGVPPPAPAQIEVVVPPPPKDN